MLKHFTSGIALAASIWVLPAQSQVPIIRTVTGVRYEIPAGWGWAKFDGYDVTVYHIAAKSDENGKNPNTFVVGVRKSYGDDYNKSWGHLDRNEKRTFPGGVSARWKAGVRFDHQYSFVGEVTIGSKALSLIILDGGDKPSFDLSLVESAFLHFAETLHEVPESKVLYHPSSGFAVDILESPPWFSVAVSNSIMFACQSGPAACGESGVLEPPSQGIPNPSQTWIAASPTYKVFADAVSAFADQKTFAQEKAHMKIGNEHHDNLQQGELIWTEQPGTLLPFMGVVQRNGRIFIVNVVGRTSDTYPHESLREDFMAVVKSVRPWDGQ